MNKMATRTVIIALTLLTLVTMSTALSTSESQQIDRLVQRVIRCTKSPALSVALIRLDDRSMHVNAFGTADTASGERATVKTRFCLGGATEAFTGVLLAKLLHENKNITWSTPLQDIIGHRVHLSDAYRSKNLNLRDILAQRTGYPNMDIVSVARPYSSDKIPSYLRFAQPVAGYREKFVPNQLLFSVLEEVFQEMANDTWQNLIKEHILEPLGMDSALFLGDKQDVVAPYVAYPVVFHNNQPITLSLESLRGQRLTRQATSLCLSAEDMAKWIRFVMRGKAANGQQLVDMDVMAETFKGVQARDNNIKDDEDPEFVGYRQPDVEISYAREQNGLGWITGHYRGFEFVSQSGSIPGVQTLATILPERRVAVYTSFTGEGGSQGLAAKTLINMFVLDVLMRGKPWFDESNVCSLMAQMKGLHDASPMEDQHVNVRKTSKYMGERKLEDFVGYYRNYAFGDILVKHNETGGDQGLSMDYGHAQFSMAPTNQNDTFQLIARGLHWYLTNTDMARKSQKIIAVFSEDPRDPEGRIRDVTITGFDRSGDVLFSHNPAPPPRYSGYHPECECGAASGLTSTVSVLLISLLSFVSFRIFSR